MRKFLTIQNLILLILALLVVGGFLIFKQSPPNATEFQRDNTSFDTSSFN